MQQRFSTCDAAMSRCTLQQFVARIISPLRVVLVFLVLDENCHFYRIFSKIEYRITNFTTSFYSSLPKVLVGKHPMLQQ